MKNIKLFSLIVLQFFVVQFTIAQATINNGRAVGMEPAPTNETVTPAANKNTDIQTTSNGEFSDQDVPGQEGEVFEDTYYPVDFDIMQEEIQASTHPAIVAEKINELDDHIADLRRVIEELRLENEVIRESLGNCCSNSALGLSASDAYLIQNQPNPFNETSQIKYFVPDGLEDVEIRITDIKGELKKSVQITDAGYGTLEVSASALSSGTFVYMIAVKGEVVDSKVMIITQ